MPKRANEVQLKVGDPTRLFIDGEEFPFDVLDNVVLTNREGITLLHITIPANYSITMIKPEEKVDSEDMPVDEPVPGWDLGYKFQMQQDEEPPAHVLVVRELGNSFTDMPYLVRHGDGWTWSNRTHISDMESSLSWSEWSETFRGTHLQVEEIKKGERD